MMKIAEEAKRQFAWTNADGYTDNELAETVSELESIITEKLKPVREAFSPICAWIEAHLPECGPGMSKRLEIAEDALALFGDER